MKDGHTIYDYTPGDAGYHGLQHQITVVNRATEHPILKGLPVRWRHYKDEIYTKLRGPARNVEILKQPQYSPMPVEEQIAIIYCGTNGLLQKVPVASVRNFETEFLFHLRENHKELLAHLRESKLIDEDLTTLRAVAEELSAKYAVKK